MDMFSEDWNASQFWVKMAHSDATSIFPFVHYVQYRDETATLLAEQLLDGATDDTAIAVVSAPSVFIQLKNILVCVYCLC